MNTTFMGLPEKIKLYSYQLINFQDFLELVVRFAFNTAVILLLVRWLYYSTTKRKDYLFTYLLIGTIIFLLCITLEHVKLEMGFALGLFAIFGILRYRTSQMPIREMTYLFLIIGVSVINALANKKVSVAEILFVNSVLVFLIYGFEKLWFLRHESVKSVIFERIDLIKPEKQTELINELQNRIGIEKINRVEIGKIDFLRDTCVLKVYYYETGRNLNMADNDDSQNKNDDGDDD
jgi:hypothetical protein